MPPKTPAKGTKGTKGSKGKKAARAPADGVAADQTARIEELERAVQELQAQLRVEQEQRNYFQLEKDKVYTLYEVAGSQLEELRAALRAKDRQIEEVMENHQVAVRVYQQKIKDILYGHQQEATQHKVSNEQSLRAEEDFHRAREAELQKEIEALKLHLKEASLGGQDMLRAGRDTHSRANALLRDQYEQQLWQLQHNYEEKLRDLLTESEIRRKAEVQEVEAAKNGQIDALVKQHEKNFAKMKAYYTSITNSNLDLIKSLRDELDDMKKRQVANEQLMYEIASENRKLTQPLQTALAEVDGLRKKLADSEKEAAALKRSHERAEVLQKEVTALRWKIEQLTQCLRDTSAERDDLKMRFESAIQDVAQRGVFRESVLERRVNALRGELEGKNAQLSEVLAAANLDGAVASAVSNQLDSVLEQKNRSIRELSFELTRVMRLYNEAIRVVRGKLNAAGIDASDLDGFRPFEINEAA